MIHLNPDETYFAAIAICIVFAVFCYCFAVKR
jgi:hypothetical protein